MNNLFTKTALSAAIALTVAACGGSGGGIAGIGGSGFISSGSVTGFGSVFVNGVEFETNSATFDVDGESGIQDDLAIGMVVQVSGTINADGETGDATHISFDDELQGPIAVGSITLPDADGETRSFTVLGVKVIVDSSSTTFDISGDITSMPAFDFDNLADKNNVEISGFFNSNGDLIATRVELKDVVFDTNSIVEVEGLITGLSGSTFTLGSLTVDASAATLDDLPNGLVNNQLVEVKGTLNATYTTLFADKVEAEDNTPDDTNEIEIEGIITDFVDKSNFKINGISVNASNATFEPASLILENDLHIEAEGSIVNGVLIADEIELEDGNIKVHAPVSSIDATANTFTVDPISGQAITITVSTDTQFESDTSENKFFNIGNLAIDDFVEVQGFDDGSGSGIAATEVDVKELSDAVVQGLATAAIGDSVNGGTMTVLGVTFDFDGTSTPSTETDFEIDSNIEGQPDINMSSAQITDLINAINLGPQLVKIVDKKLPEGNPIGTADEIEIESPI